MHLYALGPFVYVLYGVLYIFLKTSWDGAQTNIHCAVSEAVANETGKYYSDCKEKEPKPWAKDDLMARKLWDLSVKAVKLEQ